MNVFIMRRLQARALQEGGHAAERVQLLQAQKAQLLRQYDDIVQLLAIANRTLALIDGYKPLVDGRYLCPCCALEEAKQVLTELSANEVERHFVCPSCSQVFHFDLSSKN